MSSFVKAGVGQRVSAVRAEFGISQHQFALGTLSANASAKNIGRIEQGEVTPRLSTLAKIALAADIDYEWLVTGKVHLADGKPVRVPGIGQRLSQVRERRGLSQRQTAAFLSESPSAKNVGRIEQCEVRPLPRTLRSLAHGLNTSVEYLVNGL